MDDLFKMLSDPAYADQLALGAKTDAYMDRILKLMQIIYYGTQSHEEELVDKIVKTYKPVIELLAEKMNSDVAEYTKKHGEL